MTDQQRVSAQRAKSILKFLITTLENDFGAYDAKDLLHFSLLAALGEVDKLLDRERTAN